jgi:hypothetical protein
MNTPARVQMEEWKTTNESKNPFFGFSIGARFTYHIG